VSKQQPALVAIQGNRKSEFFAMSGQELAAEAAGRGKRADEALAEIQRRAHNKIVRKAGRA